MRTRAYKHIGLTIVAVLALLPLSMRAQPDRERRWNEAMQAIQQVQQTLAADIHALPGGGYTFTNYYRSEFPGYDYNKFSFSNPFKGMKNAPTATVTYKLTAQQLVMEFYDDVQYACEFDEQTGSPKRPDDPYSYYLGCKQGKSYNLTGSLYFGNICLDVPLTLTCNKHTSKQLFYSTSTREYDPRRGRMVDRSSQNPFSPWQFTHTMTVTISVNDLARAIQVPVANVYRLFITMPFSAFGLVKDIQLFELCDEEQDCLRYCYWKLAGSPTQFY